MKASKQRSRNINWSFRAKKAETNCLSVTNCELKKNAAKQTNKQTQTEFLWSLDFYGYMMTNTFCLFFVCFHFDFFLFCFLLYLCGRPSDTKKKMDSFGFPQMKLLDSCLSLKVSDLEGLIRTTCMFKLQDIFLWSSIALYMTSRKTHMLRQRMI